MKWIVVAVLALSLSKVYSSDNDLKIIDLLPFENVLVDNDNLKLVSQKELLDKPVCDIESHEWVNLKDYLVKYAVQTKDIKYETGTLSFPMMRQFRSGKEMDLILAGVCDEVHDMQDNMDDKILVIFKGILKRLASCPDVQYFTAEESCRREFLL